MKKSRFEIYFGAGLGIVTQWRWRLRAKNGNILCDSGEGYLTKGNAKRSANRLIKTLAAGAEIVVLP